MRKFALPIALVFGFAAWGCGDDDSCVDVDGDGYGQGSGCIAEDCDDNDPDGFIPMTGYSDADDDGYADSQPTDLCTDGQLPAGFVEQAGTDCDDGNADAYELITAYADVDGDGYGAGAAMDDVCGAPGYIPPGYADNGDDCDDASALVWMEHTGYDDWDGDGVHAETSTTICGTDVFPVEWSTSAGTDCDDIDAYSTNDASHPGGCAIAGACGDTELGVGMPDGRGIGGCTSVDCNGQDPTCDENPMNDTGNSCTVPGDCNVGELCWSPPGGSLTCWSIPGCCVNSNITGTTHSAPLTCSEFIPCLTQCADDFLPQDRAGYVGCQQFNCFEAATPQAQHLYRLAAECMATAGCWGLEPEGADAIELCVATNCVVEFAACTGDQP